MAPLQALELYRGRVHFAPCTIVTESRSHGIIESVGLEKTSEIIESKLLPNTTLPSRPWHGCHIQSFLNHLQGQ